MPRLSSAQPAGQSPPPRSRPYKSPRRRQQALATRDRIVGAGSELVHTLQSWDWRELTFRAVAQRAAVSERTVYRYFATERELHDAVMDRLHQEANTTYQGLELEELPDVARRVFSSMASFSASRREPPEDNPFPEVDRQRRDACSAAVRAAAPDADEGQRLQAAAMLDVLWSVPAYERLVRVWGLDSDQATRTVSWAIALVSDGISAGRLPAGRRRPRSS